MAEISLIKPLDQPPGTRRLLDDLKVALQSDSFDALYIIVAYAKSGPLHRLRELLENWRKAGKSLNIILGVDQQGTSLEAIELSQELFDNVYITQNTGITFHPKIYLFKGKHNARGFIGSNNLTVGGTEKNFESSVQIEMNLPNDNENLSELMSAWNDLMPINCAATRLLDQALLSELITQGTILKEKVLYSRSNQSGSASVSAKSRGKKSKLKIKPESPLPKSILKANQKASTAFKKTKPGTAKTKPPKTHVTARGLVMQIKPHHNGEIFLSVIAAKQNPDFFDWPFTGATTPKKAGNPTYPQMTPDPLVDVEVYGASPDPIIALNKYRLNTVYYEKNSEIRVTASPLVGTVPDYSILIMELSETDGVKYNMTIHRPDSPEYDDWLATCDQQMPSGGKPIARKFGWF